MSDVFFASFCNALPNCFFSDVGAKLGPKCVLLGPVFTTFWDQAEPVKIAQFGSSRQTGTPVLMKKCMSEGRTYA